MSISPAQLIASRLSVPEAGPELLGALGDAWREACLAQPGVGVDPMEFGDYLAGRWPDGLPPVEALSKLHLADLRLAFACRTGANAAVATFERLYATELTSAYQRVQSRGIDPEDLRQRLLERFFVGTAEAAPRIESYSGQGPLRSWVRVAATRQRIDLERRRGDKDRRLETHRERNLLDAAAADPELDFLERHYRGEFREAFAEALRGLSSRQRNLL